MPLPNAESTPPAFCFLRGPPGDAAECTEYALGLRKAGGGELRRRGDVLADMATVPVPAAAEPCRGSSGMFVVGVRDPAGEAGPGGEFGAGLESSGFGAPWFVPSLDWAPSEGAALLFRACERKYEQALDTRDDVIEIPLAKLGMIRF